MEVMANQDIIEQADIFLLVNSFYKKILEDDLLFRVFDPVIKDDWDYHLKRMTDFWSTLLLYTHAFKDDPMPKHHPLPLDKEHFDRWLQLFNQTIDELFEGAVAENARKRANSIARIIKAVKKIPE